ncbi:hypothetical protein BB559_001412 [Furculomyces boomerangus]|uniref:Uncharacterized protein n=1 Tax=Furculomyces boomerangus TaxID=61424 RepID=A0A2T9Z255_9FUNG|nr:hypothetical protein BB559_001412 [Furculomyces boomerangus]
MRKDSYHFSVSDVKKCKVAVSGAKNHYLFYRNSNGTIACGTSEEYGTNLNSISVTNGNSTDTSFAGNVGSQNSEYTLVVGVTHGDLGPSETLCLSDVKDDSVILSQNVSIEKSVMNNTVERTRYLDFSPRKYCKNQIKNTNLTISSQSKLVGVYDINCNQNYYTVFFKLSSPTNNTASILFNLENTLHRCNVTLDSNVNNTSAYVQVLKGAVRCGTGNPITGTVSNESVFFSPVLYQLVSKKLVVVTENTSVESSFSICHSDDCKLQSGTVEPSTVQERTLQDIGSVVQSAIKRNYCEQQVYKALQLEKNEKTNTLRYLNPCFDDQFTFMFNSTIIDKAKEGIAFFGLTRSNGVLFDFDLFSMMLPSTAINCGFFLQVNEKYIIAGIGGIFNGFGSCPFQVLSVASHTNPLPINNVELLIDNISITTPNMVCLSDACPNSNNTTQINPSILSIIESQSQPTSSPISISSSSQSGPPASGVSSTLSTTEIFSTLIPNNEISSTSISNTSSIFSTNNETTTTLLLSTTSTFTALSTKSILTTETIKITSTTTEFLPTSTQQGNSTITSSTQPGNSTTPSSTQQGNSTITSSTQQGNITVTSSTQSGNSTTPSSTQQGNITVTSSTQSGNSTTPSSTQSGNSTTPSSTQSGNSTVTSSTQSGNSIITSSTQSGNSTITSSTQSGSGTAPSSTITNGIISLEGEEGFEIGASSEEDSEIDIFRTSKENKDTKNNNEKIAANKGSTNRMAVATEPDKNLAGLQLVLKEEYQNLKNLTFLRVELINSTKTTTEYSSSTITHSTQTTTMTVNTFTII